MVLFLELWILKTYRALRREVEEGFIRAAFHTGVRERVIQAERTNLVRG